MKRILYLLAGLSFAVAMSTTLSSCSEEDNTVEEFPNWQETNEKYFKSLLMFLLTKVMKTQLSRKLLTVAA